MPSSNAVNLVFFLPSIKYVVGVSLPALIAIATIYFTNRNNVRLEEKKKISEKIEDLYELALTYGSSSKSLLWSMVSGGAYGPLTLDYYKLQEVSDVVSKISVIMFLFFKDRDFDEKRYYPTSSFPIIEFINDQDRDPRKFMDVFEESERYSKDRKAELVILCKVLAKAYGISWIKS